MGITAVLVGNVLAAPALKNVSVKGEDRTIAELRVMSGFYRRSADGTLEQVNDKTFPVQVTIWQEDAAKRVFAHIKVGASVVVTGDLYVDPWLDENEDPQAGVRIDAQSVALNLQRVEKIVYRPRQPREQSGAGMPQYDQSDMPPYDPSDPLAP